MTQQEAKAILTLYRPGTNDAENPEFAEALRLCEQDQELRAWFNSHCEVYQTLRGRFRSIAVPEGLQAQILAERKVHTRTSPKRSHARLIFAAAAVTVMVVILMLQWLPSAEDKTFTGFRQRMVSKALRSYGMDLLTSDPEKVRAFLAERGSISDYVLPKGLRNAKIAGCAATTWQGKRVSMICFQSGQPLRPGQISDLWLFIADASSVPGVPQTSEPAEEEVLTAVAASWTLQGKTYMLAMEGNPETLRKFL